MTLDVGDVLKEGLRRLLAPTGLLWLGVFLAFGLTNALVQQSLNRVQFEQFFDPAELAPLLSELPVTADDIVEMVEESTPLALLESSSLMELLALAVVLAFVAEAIRIVTVRTFVSDATDRIPPELLTRRLGWAVLNGFVAGVIVGVLVILGTILFVIPGIFLAISFLFVRQEVAVADENVVGAIEGSWRLASGNRFTLFLLALVLVVIWFGLSMVGGLIAPGPSVAASVVSVSVDSAMLAYSVAVISRAYYQLGEDTVETEDEFEDIDPELLP